MTTTTYRTLDGRDVEFSLNPAIGYARAAETLAQEIAELTDGVHAVYVETGRRGSEANVKDRDATAWRRFDVDEFFERTLATPEAMARIREARDRGSARDL